MLIRDIGSTKAYHVPTDSAKKFIAAGLAVEVAVDGPNLRPRNMKWIVVLTEDGLNPIMNYSCGCGSHGNIAGPTAHKTQKIGHCGIQEAPPPTVLEAYEKLLRKKAEWIERNRKSENKGKLEALRSRQ
jgi:hypothetical protein